MKYQITNLEELQAFSSDFLAKLGADNKEATLVLLSGDLGVGKTAFVKACAQKLGIEEDITSPTFVIQKEYELKDQVFTQMIHIDAYRLEGKGELELLGWSRLLKTPATLIFLEWPEQVAGIDYPSNTYTLSFTITEDESREISTAGPLA